MKNPIISLEWQKLVLHHQKMQNLTLREMFEADPKRFQKFSLDSCGLFLDYSKNRINEKTLQLLGHLAKISSLKTHINEMFNGKMINTTEKRAALHTALRNPTVGPIKVNGVNVMPEIHATLQQMRDCAEKIRARAWFGFSNQPIQTIVNIGIGGSNLGPLMVTKALTPYAADYLNYYFISNIDGTSIAEVFKKIDPATTLFIVASKTFTTQETLTNATTAKHWLLRHAPDAATAIKRHFVAVTAAPQAAVAFGITQKNIFPFWDWVGGRYSLWSAIGLPIAIILGMDNFQELLQGAYLMDQHFRKAPTLQNMPVILALLSIWNINFLDARTLAIIPYDQYLEYFPAYLQQLEMESNGKCVRLDGTAVNYRTAPVVWGGVGTDGQHAFHQLLFQGTQILPIDFILPLQSHHDLAEHHLLLCANCFAQSQALMQGKTLTEVTSELAKSGMNQNDLDAFAPHKVIRGNNPSNTILIKKITPATLGALIALYEHKTFVEGVIWGINSFDQWGVELGKKLCQQLVPQLQGRDTAALDSSTAGLVSKYCQAFSA